MDYSQLSDFEINKFVAKQTGTEVAESVQFVNCGEDITKHRSNTILMRVITDNRKHWKLYDPCNNPADAWPIIQDNGINILWDWNEPGIHGATAEPLFEYEDKNALRAAMVVFLKMRGFHANP